MHREISLLSTSVFIKNRLIKRGYNSYLDILNADLNTICKDLKISEHQMKDIIDECSNSLEKQFNYKRTNEIHSIPIEICEDNHVLQGFLKTQSIYELIGLPSSGKTNFALKAAISWASHRRNSNIYYLDTEGSIFLDQFKELSSNNELLSRIFYARVFTEAQLLKFFTKLDEKISTDCSLLIIDSINFLLKDLSSSDINRPKLIVRMGMHLHENAQKKNLCILIVNNYTNSMQAILGESWACVISKRIKLKQSNFCFIDA